LIIVDEFASLEKPEEAWASIEPVADIGGRVMILSTAKGSGNLFHVMWQQASTGRSSFKPLFIPWSAVPSRDDAWFAQKVDEMLPWVRAQEYPSDPDEAFVMSGAMVFDFDALKAAEKAGLALPRYVRLSEDLAPIDHSGPIRGGHPVRPGSHHHTVEYVA
jgi:hypothetical protein